MNLWSKQSIKYCSCGSADCWGSEERDVLYKRANVLNEEAYSGSFVDVFKNLDINYYNDFSVSVNSISTDILHFKATEKKNKFKFVLYQHDMYSLYRTNHEIGYIYIYDLGNRCIFRFEPNPNEEASKNYNTQNIKKYITKAFSQ